MKTTNYHRLQYDLALQVQKRNELNALTFDIYGHCAEALKPYIDKKICKLTPYKTWIKALKDKFDEIDLKVGRRNRLIFYFSQYMISAELTLAFDSNDKYFYKKQWFSLALLDQDGVSLASLIDAPDLRTDYVAEEVESKIISIAQLKEELYRLERQVQEFEV